MAIAKEEIRQIISESNMSKAMNSIQQTACIPHRKMQAVAI